MEHSFSGLPMYVIPLYLHKYCIFIHFLILGTTCFGANSMPDLTHKNFTQLYPTDSYFILVGNTASYRCNADHMMEDEWANILGVKCLAENKYELPEMEDIPNCIPYKVCEDTPAYPTGSDPVSDLLHNFIANHIYIKKGNGASESVDFTCPSNKYQIFEDHTNLGDKMINACLWSGEWTYFKEQVDKLECKSMYFFAF